jgi:hypothetical protein
VYPQPARAEKLRLPLFVELHPKAALVDLPVVEPTLCRVRDYAAQAMDGRLNLVIGLVCANMRSAYAA